MHPILRLDHLLLKNDSPESSEVTAKGDLTKLDEVLRD